MSFEAVEMVALTNSEDREKWKAVFKTLDTNGDGLVSVSEVRAALLRSGGQWLRISEDEVDALLKSTDANQNGIVEFDEFLALVGSHRDVAESLYHRTILSIGDTWTPLTGREYARKHYHCRPPPLCILGITLLQIVVYVVIGCWTGENLATGCPGCYMEWDGETIPGLLTFNAYYRVYLYPFVTYAFMHKGVVHLYGNMFLQLMVGVPLEFVHRWRLVLLYFMSVITGAMMAHVVAPSTLLVGASAGVFGLVAAAIAQTIMNWDYMPEPWIRVLFAGGYLVHNVLYTTVITPLVSSHCMQSSWTAHLGGALTGFLFGVYILVNFHEQPWERRFKHLCLLLYIILFVLLFIGCVFRDLEDGDWRMCKLKMQNNTFTPSANASRSFANLGLFGAT